MASNEKETCVSEDFLAHLVHDLPKMCDAVEIANSVCESLRPEADEKGVSLICRAPTGAVSFEADPYIMDKAIFNLIDNAIRYTEQGGRVQVDLSLQGDFVEIKVTDDGKGIEEKKLDLVLRPFEEVFAVLDRELRGFGLGLANVKRYAELHGGKLEAKSTPGTGSAFSIRIPRSHGK